jgi:glycosyltransferase domain-containing protein
MSLPVTLVIPTHNRHDYLKRAIDYYKEFPSAVFIADSSPTAFNLRLPGPDFNYFHLPGCSLTKKLSIVFNELQTDFVVMCADDDFINYNGFNASLDFLKAHPDYSSASGNCICYKKNSLDQKKIEFAAIYKDRLSHEISSQQPFQRLASFFNTYRTIFYAIHRTDNLKIAFNAARDIVSNLFLNEYLTSIVPIMMGNYKELRVLYQIREFAEDSRDKITSNLDSLFHNNEHKKEYEALLFSQAAVISPITNKSIDECFKILNEIFLDYAKRLPELRNNQVNSFDKKLGKIINMIPYVGEKIIKAFRTYKRKKEVSLIVSTEENKKDLAMIEKFIIKHKDKIK